MMKNFLIAFDVDGVLKGYGGPIDAYIIDRYYKDKYYVGIISARADHENVKQRFRMDFSYSWNGNALQQAQKDYPNLKAYIYVTDNAERIPMAEGLGWTVLAPEVVAKTVTIWDLMMLKMGLAIVMYVANFFDYYTTKKALELGLKEGNPLAKTIIRMGWRKYQIAKFTIPMVYALYGTFSDDPYYVNLAGLAICALTFIYAAINNFLLVERFKVK
jgi:hypothetical protein